MKAARIYDKLTSAEHRLLTDMLQAQELFGSFVPRDARDDRRTKAFVDEKLAEEDPRDATRVMLTPLGVEVACLALAAESETEEC